MLLLDRFARDEFGHAGGRRAFGREVLTALRPYPWPGNVSELKGAVVRLAAICKNGSVRPAADALVGALADDHQAALIELDVADGEPSDLGPAEPEHEQQREKDPVAVPALVGLGVGRCKHGAERVDAGAACVAIGANLGPAHVEVPDDQAGFSREPDGAEWAARPEEGVTIVARKPRTVVGRALFQGVPLPFFGVRLRPGGEKYLGAVHAVRDPDGRFCLSVHQPGTFGVELAGPGTLRRKLSALEAAPGETLDLGDVELPRGQHVSGRVHDAAGNPVKGARVLLGTPGPDVDLPGRWFHGNYEATTDVAGQYRFDGIAPPDYGCALAARHPTFGVSPPHPLSDRADVVVDLELGPSSGIDGLIQGYSSGLVFVQAVLLDPREIYSASVNALGEFRFDDLPPGDYTLEMITPFKKPTPPPQIISLQPGQRQTVTLVMTDSDDPT